MNVNVASWTADVNLDGRLTQKGLVIFETLSRNTCSACAPWNIRRSIWSTHRYIALTPAQLDLECSQIVNTTSATSLVQCQAPARLLGTASDLVALHNRSQPASLPSSSSVRRDAHPLHPLLGRACLAALSFLSLLCTAYSCLHDYSALFLRSLRSALRDSLRLGKQTLLPHGSHRVETRTPITNVGTDSHMADNKRNSIAGKVATPNLKSGGGASKDVIDVDSNLYKAVGSR